MPNILNNNLEVICYACGKGEFPENTLEAIAHCLNVNPSWRIEMDLQLTKDGRVVLFHDNNLLRVTGIEKSICETPYSDLQNMDAAFNYKKELGYPLRGKTFRIPLLENVFRHFPKIKYLLDIQSTNPEIVDEVIQLVEGNYVDKQIVLVSKHHNITERFRLRRPYWKYGATSNEIQYLLLSHFLGITRFFNLQADIVMMPVIHKNRKILSKNLASLIAKKNKETWVWLHEGKQVVTIDSKNQFERIKKLNVDAFFTSYPEQLHEQVFSAKI